MASIPDLNSVAIAVEKDFAAYCAKKGCEAPAIDVFPELYDRDAAIKITFGEGDEKLVSGYAKSLKKRFGYIGDGEGEEFAVDLVFPAARASELATALNNPSAPKLKKEFNTVVFSGTMTVERGDAIKAATDAGFHVADKVTKDTDYLVIGDKPGSKLDKAEELGVKVLTEPQWARLLKKSAPK